METKLKIRDDETYTIYYYLDSDNVEIFVKKPIKEQRDINNLQIAFNRARQGER